MDVTEPPESPHKGKTGLRRILNAWGYSMSGLYAAFVRAVGHPGTVPRAQGDFVTTR
jgi:hypothetical protein